MSSRWISISFSGASPLLREALIDACDRLDQRRLAHAARAPQKHVVGGQAGGETLGVVDQDVAHAVDAADQPDVDAVDALHRLENARLGRPDEAVGRGEIGRLRRRRRQAADRLDQPVELFGERFQWSCRSFRKSSGCFGLVGLVRGGGAL